MSNLQNRVKKLQPAAMNLYFDSMTDEELKAIASNDLEGVPFDEFSDAELEAIAAGSRLMLDMVKARWRAKNDASLQAG